MSASADRLQRPERERSLLTLLFFASGAAGLVYEVVWLRMFASFFGVTLYATSVVVACFMGGLALGSYLVGRLVERHGRALKTYAALEVALGVLALLVPYGLSASQPLYSSIYERVAGDLRLVTLARTVHAVLLLLLPTALMGGTLPALSQHLTASCASGASAGLGTTAARLYAVNTLGAVTGILVAVAILVPRLGTRGTGIACALLNIAVGCVAWFVAISWPRTAMPAQARVAGRARRSTDPRPAVRTSLAVAALSGFAALGYQMIWVRAVALNTADTIFGFGATVSAYLAGIALGARLLADRSLEGRGWSYLAACQWGLAVFALLSPFVIRLLFGSVGDLSATTLAALLTRQWLLVLVALLVPTSLMGASLALAFRLHRQDTRDRESASGIGAVYACNTLGAIAGSLVTGMLLIPMLGAVPALATLSGFNLLAALVAARAARARSQGSVGHLQQLAAIAAVGLALWVGLASTTTFHPRPRGTLVFSREDASGVVEVVESDGVLTLVANRIHTWGSNARENVDSSKRQGYLPLFLHPQPRRVIEVGLATGVASAPLLADPRVEELVVVEISPAIVEASSLFDRENGGIVRHGKARVVVDDGRNYLMHADEHFDLIVLGLFTPYSPWAGLLFSRELYAAARERLAPGGLLVQWLPLQQLGPAALRTVVASFQAVFPGAHAWEKGQYVALVGGTGDLRIQARTLAAVWSDPGLRAEAARIGFGSAAGVLATYLTGPRGLQALAAGAQQNTDEQPRVEWSPVAGASERLALLVENLTALLDVRSLDEQPVVDLPEADHSELERAFEARGYSLRGAMHEILRDYDRALESYRRALALYPRDEIATAQIEKYTGAGRAAMRERGPRP